MLGQLRAQVPHWLRIRPGRGRDNDTILRLKELQRRKPKLLGAGDTIFLLRRLISP